MKIHSLPESFRLCEAKELGGGVIEVLRHKRIPIILESLKAPNFLIKVPEPFQRWPLPHTLLTYSHNMSCKVWCTDLS